MKNSETPTTTRRIASAVSLSIAAALLLGATTSSGAANDTVNKNAEAILTCDMREAIISDLKNGYSEQPVALGVTSAGTVMELWTAANGDTWTLMVTLTDGNSCVIGAGDSWTTIQRTAIGKIL